MNAFEERAGELIAAALAGELTPDESTELDALRAAHPWIDEEIEGLGGIAERAAASGATWTEVTAGDDLRDRILAETGGSTQPSDVPDISRVPDTEASARRHWWAAPLLAAACVAVGVGVGVGVPAAMSVSPSGPPGTLGAVEPVEIQDDLDAVRIDASVVAHTWGTEAVLHATGLDVGRTYSVVLIDAAGDEFSAGQMLGSEVPIDCRLNAAVLREDVATIEIRSDDGSAIAVADLPQV